MTLNHAYMNGRLLAFQRFKLAEAPSHPVVRSSSLLGGRSPAPQINAPSTLTPPALREAFNAQEQVATKQDPDRKLAAEGVCTTCRQPKHYGPCKKTPRSVETILKSAHFNAGLYGNGADNGQSSAPSTSPHYTSGTVADSGPARARPGDPADQARSTHQDFLRPSFQNQMADEWGNAYGALVKTCRESKRASALIPGGSWERRGPFVDPYAERLLRLSPPIARGPVGDQAVDHAFGQIDAATDSTSIESGTGQPQGGPAVLG